MSVHQQITTDRSVQFAAHIQQIGNMSDVGLVMDDMGTALTRVSCVFLVMEMWLWLVGFFYVRGRFPRVFVSSCPWSLVLDKLVGILMIFDQMFDQCLHCLINLEIKKNNYIDFNYYALVDMM